jgi:hypothetical protein
MLEPDLMAYKALRDALLAGHPESFTSDAETEGQQREQRARAARSSTLLTWSA